MWNQTIKYFIINCLRKKLRIESIIDEIRLINDIKTQKENNHWVR
jgi:hypothetical protein